MKVFLQLALGAFVLVLASGFARGAESGDSVVVIYNKRMPESKAVADYYASKRRVPDSQVIGYNLPTTETMARAEFRDGLQRPLFSYLVLRGIFTLALPEPVPPSANPGQHLAKSSIRYLALCYGVPTRIVEDNTLAEQIPTNLPPAMAGNHAAVDSELVWLPVSRQPRLLSGPMPSPFYAVTNLALFHPTNGLLMVSRLDGPTPEIARGLVDKALQAEQDGLWGRAYFDGRGITAGAYALGDEWMTNAARITRQMGFETELDTSEETLPVEYPLSQVAFYAGWYAENFCGPFSRPVVEFMPGAIAYHLHSFSAGVLRTATNYWAGPLLAKGATATMGYVHEPFLPFTADLAVFFRCLLLHRGSLGEAAWSAQKAVSWQTTVVGDPLYRPWAAPLDRLHHQLEARMSPLAAWSHLLVINRNQAMGQPPEALLQYLGAIHFAAHSAVLTEKAGDLLAASGKSSEAVEFYRRALTMQPTPQQRVRLLVAVAQTQTSAKHDSDAIATWRQLLREVPDYPNSLNVHRRLLALARKTGDSGLEAQSEREIRRLAGLATSATNAPPP